MSQKEYEQGLFQAAEVRWLAWLHIGRLERQLLKAQLQGEKDLKPLEDEIALAVQAYYHAATQFEQAINGSRYAEPFRMGRAQREQEPERMIRDAEHPLCRALGKEVTGVFRILHQDMHRDYRAEAGGALTLLFGQEVFRFVGAGSGVGCLSSRWQDPYTEPLSDQDLLEIEAFEGRPVEVDWGQPRRAWHEVVGKRIEAVGMLAYRPCNDEIRGISLRFEGLPTVYLLGKPDGVRVMKRVSDRFTETILAALHPVPRKANLTSFASESAAISYLYH